MQRSLRMIGHGLAHIFEADAIPSTLPKREFVLLTPENVQKRDSAALAAGLREC